jgi:hypothetical protein
VKTVNSCAERRHSPFLTYMYLLTYLLTYSTYSPAYLLTYLPNSDVISEYIAVRYPFLMANFIVDNGYSCLEWKDMVLDRN